MPPMGHIIGIAAMGKAMLDTINYQRLLPKLAILVTLAVITGILTGLLAAGLFYAAYQLLVRHGLDADVAFMVTGIGVAAAATIFAILTAGYIRKLRQALQPLSPIASGVGDSLRSAPGQALDPSSAASCGELNHSEIKWVGILPLFFDHLFGFAGGGFIEQTLWVFGRFRLNHCFLVTLFIHANLGRGLLLRGGSFGIGGTRRFLIFAWWLV